MPDRDAAPSRLDQCPCCGVMVESPDGSVEITCQECGTIFVVEGEEDE